ncbi:MAG: glycogen synthase [Magnetococcales bacterium]|nr:glycogen synthase [Magnetococcales bacterium]
MHVVMVASECAPVAKVGGLGDVIYGLSREMAIRGNSVEVILPKYDCMRYDHIWGLSVSYDDLWVPWYGGSIHCTVWSGFVHGQLCFFIDPHSSDQFFNRGSYYGFFDEAKRYAFFSRAALEFMYRSGKRPDIIHTHDWQTALIPVMLCELYAGLGMQNCRVVHTIHNFKHQGVASGEILAATNLHRPDFYFAEDRMRDPFNPFALNFTHGAMVYSNFVTTVSPKHAWEARHTDQGYGLGHVLHRYQDKFGGILNGLDYQMWNPELDPHIAHHFTAGDLTGKAGNKKALRHRLMLQDNDKPIISYVGRLDTQKGVHLIRHALFTAIWNGAQFALLGSSPEYGINDDFWHLKHFLNDNPDCHLEIGFNEELAHLIYAGSDMFVVPSLFEPCGLTQMISLRYGTVPIVRAVGGLVDTVFDWDYSPLPREQRNGFTFDHPDFAGIESAMRRALGLWGGRPDLWQQLRVTGMQYDYSWNQPGQHYLQIYEFVRHK